MKFVFQSKKKNEICNINKQCPFYERAPFTKWEIYNNDIRQKRQTLHTSSAGCSCHRTLSRTDSELIFTQKDIPPGSTIQGNRGISDQQEIGNRRIHRAFQTNPINPQALESGCMEQTASRLIKISTMACWLLDHS